MTQTEGVIKFQLKHTLARSDSRHIGRLESWRRVFYMAGLIGRDPRRYGGASYGNMSMRLEPYRTPEHKRSFLVTGTQTGHKPLLNSQDYARVKEYHWAENLVISDGPVQPSSESLTHGAVYQLSSAFHFVVHVHSPSLWRKAKLLGLPSSRKSIPYGTPQMAEEVVRLFKETDLKNQKIFAMGGHEDGILSFGASAQEACGLLLRAYAASLS